jgi:transglutaminase-like putative cysteine protease
MSFYKIKHITRYTYESPVIDCTNQVMLYPILDSYLEVRRHEVFISQSPLVETFTDFFGNRVGVFSVIKPHKELLIVSEADVITKPVQLPVNTSSAQEQWLKLNLLKDEFRFIDFFEKEGFDGADEVAELVKGIIDYTKTPFENAQALAAYIYDFFEYKKGITDVLTKTDEVWKLKAGVCQDFAHILLVMLRLANIPARYVSGYICPKEQAMRGTGATHAWAEAYLPDYGWIGLDPTNNCIVSDGHVRLAVGRSFADCTPVKGTYKGSGEHTLEVSVQIENGIKLNNANEGFSPVIHNPSPNTIPLNSYRRHIEIKQQEQQQQ